MLSAADRGTGLAGDAVHEDAASLTELLHQQPDLLHSRFDRRPAVS